MPQQRRVDILIYRDFLIGGTGEGVRRKPLPFGADPIGIIVAEGEAGNRLRVSSAVHHLEQLQERLFSLAAYDPIHVGRVQDRTWI